MPTIQEIRKAAEEARLARDAVNNPGVSKEQLAAKHTKEQKAKEDAFLPKTEETVRYFCRIAGHRFIFEDGTEAIFAYGRLDIGPKTCPGTWRQYQKELNAILGKQTTIFLPDAPPLVAPEVIQNAKSELEIAEGEKQLLTGNVRVNQEMGAHVTTGAPTDVNQSTVDPSLQKAMLGALPSQVDAVNAALANQVGAASSIS